MKPTMKKNDPLEKNLLICGDNLNALDDLIKKGIRADLIYLDPPFFSNRHYEVIWGDEAEVRSFKDRWEGGINVYIEWMRERVAKLHDVLKNNGSIYLHCDWHAGHYLKVMMDEIFGADNFRNNIIWHYSGWNRHGTEHFNRRYDDILFYGKTRKSKFYSYATPWQSKEEYVRVRKQKIRTDAEGREYVLSDAGEGKRAKRYLLEAMKDGKPADDVWDIDKLNNSSKEKTGYPTQKPEALLVRIIEASSKKGDLVLDPFCGCGTTLSVAQRTGRRWMGIDISPTAVSLVAKRMSKIYAIKQGKDFDINGMPTTLKELGKLEPFEFQNWVINKLQARQSKKLRSDFGIDGYYDKTIFTARAGIQVKQSENVGRNVVDNFETALSRGKFEKGFIVAFSFTKGAHEEAARVKSEGVEIKLIEVEDLLLGKVKI
jgi:DNA modification methylase